MGSEKGIPSSIISAPLSKLFLMSVSVKEIDVSPNVKYGIKTLKIHKFEN